MLCVNVCWVPPTHLYTLTFTAAMPRTQKKPWEANVVSVLGVADGSDVPDSTLVRNLSTLST